MKNRFLNSVAASLCLLISIISCQREVDGKLPDAPPQPPAAEVVAANVSGRVVDETNTPVVGALVKAGNAVSTTNINGEFIFQNALLNKDAGFITVEKNGYFTGSRTLVIDTKADNKTVIQLIPKKIAGTFNSSSGGSVTVPNGGSVVFPNNGVVSSTSNTAYSGEVSVAASFLNPKAENFNEIMPGSLRGVRDNNAEVGLESFGMMAVELSGANGEKLQLASGKKATITFPIPSELLSSAPASIPLWYFDEVTGFWKEEGTATKQGSNYIGQVSHFSFWNCDAPYSLIDFDASFKSQNGSAIANAKVVLSTASNKNIISGSDITDESGSVSGKIPANMDLLMEVYNTCGEVIYTKNITTSSTKLSLGTVTITNNISSVVISGVVTSCNAAPVTNGFVHIAIGQQVYRAAVTNGAYTATITVCSAGTHNAMLIGFDLSTNKHSDSIKTTVNTATPTTVPVSICANTIEQFVNYKVNGIQYSLVHPADSLQFDSQSWGDYIYAVSKTKSAKVNITTQKITGLGSVALSALNISLRDTAFMGQNINNITITEYQQTPTGFYISGNLSGNVRADSTSTSISYPVEVNFRVKK